MGRVDAIYKITLKTLDIRYMVRISGDGYERDDDGFRQLDLGRVDLSMPLQDADVIRSVLPSFSQGSRASRTRCSSDA